MQLKPEAVFLDIEMPLMNGLETARALNELKLPPKIVFATAYPQFGVEAFRFEALDYLLKPIDEERLAETVRRLEQSLRRKARQHPVIPNLRASCRWMWMGKLCS